MVMIVLLLVAWVLVAVPVALLFCRATRLEPPADAAIAVQQLVEQALAEPERLAA